VTPSIHIEVIRKLIPIIPEWEDLFARCPSGTPFQSPAWLVSWWHAFGTGDPLVIAARQGGRLVGLGAFYVYDGDRERPAQLFFLGKSVSDYLDILVTDDESAPEVAQAIFDSVFARTDLWRYADLDRLRHDSSVLHVKHRSGIQKHRLQEGVCPELKLKGGAIRQIVTKNTRNALRKHLNRARTLGHVEFVTGDSGTFDDLFRHLVQFHSARWRSAGLSGVFSDTRMIAFLHDAAGRLLRQGTLQLPAMLLNGVPVAVAFGMLHRERHYFYLCDFDPAYDSISPGTLLTAYTMEQSAQRGAKYFDFLQGEEEYKYKKWAAQPRYTYRVQYSRENAASATSPSPLQVNSSASLG
jgi:CelD/BcsL family acetyltransferase involved in cellulose biosynthesis